MRGRRDLVEHRVAAASQLRAHLQIVFPGPVGLFAALDSEISLRFLERFTTQLQSDWLTPARLGAWLDKQGYSGRVAAEVLHARLLTAPRGTTGPDTEAHAAVTHSFVAVLTTHKRVEVRDWLAANPRFHAHFTPTSGSWLNLVEVWFSIIDRQAIRRGTFVSVTDLVAKIRQFINGWNPRAHPFIWTKTPDQILDTIDRKRKHVSSTGH